MLPTVPCLTGTTTTRTTATTTTVSVLCVQPTSVGWLCKEIIKIFRLRGSAGPALKATQAAGNNRNPPLKTFRTGLLPAGYGFSVQCKCFCRTCAGSPQVAPCERSSPAFLFCAILIFIDLTKKRVGGILKEGSARTSGYLH